MSAPTMIGVDLPDISAWSERVTVALGQNPSLFTGPGTNTYLIGTGERRILLDTGQGVPAYLEVLQKALWRTGCRIQEIVLSHAHVDHIGGAAQVIEQHGPLRVSKLPLPDTDARYDVEVTPIEDGAVLRTEGATLRAIHTPGHARDHLCFVLEEENALFSGDNVLGVGTTVIPAEGGDLFDYMRSLDRLLEARPGTIYPAHGPLIPDGVGKLREYVDHRLAREREIVDAVRDGLSAIPDVVKRVYAAYPKSLHAAAGQSVCSHLLKLEREGRCERDGESPLAARWRLR